ncbi:hypothetical protein Tco_1050556 [Tanacetum coccineum]
MFLMVLVDLSDPRRKVESQVLRGGFRVQNTVRSSSSPILVYIGGAKLAKVIAIKEAKDLATLPPDELIKNLKVYEMILENDVVASKTTKEKVKSLALKLKTSESSSKRVVDSDAAINLATRIIDSKEAVEMVSGIKVAKDQDKSEVVTITGNKVASLVSVQSPKRTRFLSKELGVIVKMVMNLKMMQLVSKRSTLK